MTATVISTRLSVSLNQDMALQNQEEAFLIGFTCLGEWWLSLAEERPSLQGVAQLQRSYLVEPAVLSTSRNAEATSRYLYTCTILPKYGCDARIEKSPEHCEPSFSPLRNGSHRELAVQIY